MLKGNFHSLYPWHMAYVCRYIVFVISSIRICIYLFILLFFHQPTAFTSFCPHLFWIKPFVITLILGIALAGGVPDPLLHSSCGSLYFLSWHFVDALDICSRIYLAYPKFHSKSFQLKDKQSFLFCMSLWELRNLYGE